MKLPGFFSERRIKAIQTTAEDHFVGENLDINADQEDRGKFEKHYTIQAFEYNSLDKHYEGRNVFGEVILIVCEDSVESLILCSKEDKE